MYKYHNIYDYGSIDPKLDIRIWTSFEEICSEWSGLPCHQLPNSTCWPISGNEYSTFTSFKDAIYKYQDEQCWGFFNRKQRTVNIWFTKQSSTRSLMLLLAHEIGHSMEKDYKKLNSKPEILAKSYEHVALAAWDLAFKLQKDYNYGV